MRNVFSLVLLLVAHVGLFEATAAAEHCPSHLEITPDWMVTEVGLKGWRVHEVKDDKNTAEISGKRQLTIGSATCSVEIAGGKLVPSSECAGEDTAKELNLIVDFKKHKLQLVCASEEKTHEQVVLHRDAVTEAKGRFELRGATGQPVELVLKMDDDKLVLDRVLVRGKSGESLILKVNKGRATFPADAAKLAQDVFSGKVTLLAETNTGGDWRLLTLEQMKAPGACVADPNETEYIPRWCSDRAAHIRDHELICFDSTSGSLTPVKLPNRAMVVPNRAFLVVVRRCSDTEVAVRLDGEASISVPEANDARSEKVRAVEQAAVMTMTAVQAAGTKTLATEADGPKQVPAVMVPAVDTVPEEVRNDALAAARAVDALNENLAKVSGALKEAEAQREAVLAIEEPSRSGVPKKDKGAIETALKEVKAAVRACQPRSDLATCQKFRPEDAQLEAGPVEKALPSLKTAVSSFTSALATLRDEMRQTDGLVNDAQAKLNTLIDTASAVLPPLPVPKEYVRSFGPRRPGRLSLGITAGENKDPVNHEIVVLQQAWGALRIGAATVFDFGKIGGDAVPPSYEARTPSGSQTQVVTIADGGTASFELVLGAAPYLIDLIAWGGRSYANDNNAYVAPYVGLGVLSADATGLDALKSLYLGFEVELSSQISIAAAWVLRRVTQLSGNLKEGSPVEGSGLSTKSDIGTGFGLVLNVSPEIFQFNRSAPGQQPSTTLAQEKAEAIVGGNP